MPNSVVNPLTLRDLQIWLKWVITDPRGVAGALAQPHPEGLKQTERYSSPQISAFDWISDSGPLSRVARLDIYAEGYFARVADSLKADFPLTEHLVGADSFLKLVADYLKVFPSQTWNINSVGRNFAHFLADYEDLKNASFLVDVAKMEWLLLESFYSDNSSTLSADHLASLSDDDWATARPQLAPSIRLIESQWPLDALWQQRQNLPDTEVASGNLQATPESQGFLIYRINGSVFLETLTDMQFYVLQAFQANRELFEALEAAQENFADGELSQEVMVWFQAWVSKGIICGLKIRGEK